ncbi:MAG: right-handed parallel beta-helix repeat-containing protein [Bacteroidetes bacterium]|nr:right-handed parallel beta-helix repeat-containing protein [Bacteroidota bacterium]
MQKGRLFNCIILLVGLPIIGFCQSSTPLKQGMLIQSNTLIERTEYLLEAPANLTNAVITISGKNITVDFNEAKLLGTTSFNAPNKMHGLAIKISPGSENIILKNAHISGYKIAIEADSVKNLSIINCNLSYNWRPELHSNNIREDVSDWMSYHKNDHDEWKRYGAAIYLNNCTKAFIQNNQITGVQCALLMTKCNGAEVLDNDFSFNSGLGIGMYRSSNNKIYHNKLDFNIRGYYYGKYQRGQDSSGILAFEQSSDNIFAYNSATHGGDGFFLWAGQTTMDTGLGGCNNNFIYGNDFSYASNNGVEITFSSNSVLHNRIVGCDYGIWAGYSYDSDLSDNQFAHNKTAIGIEHGQSINIAMNEFNSDRTAIKLWSAAKQSDSWIYPTKRNTQSKIYWIAANRFMNNNTVYDIMGTDTIVFSGNQKTNVINEFKLGDRISELDTTRESEALELDIQKDKRLNTIKYTTLPAQAFPQGNQEIRITAWGPYNFKYPLLWLKNIDSNQQMHFEVLGPKGKWNVGSISGYQIIAKGVDSFPSTLVAKMIDTAQQKSIQLNYTGAKFIDQFGQTKKENVEQSFAYSTFDPKNTWHVKWFAWDSATNPNTQYRAFTELLNTKPLQDTSIAALDFVWWGKIAAKLPADSFATLATSILDLKKGTYEIGITADDLVKLWVDGVEQINAWDAKNVAYDEYTHHSIQLDLNGKHEFKIVQVDNTGLATLQFYIKPIKQVLSEK